MLESSFPRIEGRVACASREQLSTASHRSASQRGRRHRTRCAPSRIAQPDGNDQPPRNGSGGFCVCSRSLRARRRARKLTSARAGPVPRSKQAETFLECEPSSNLHSRVRPWSLLADVRPLSALRTRHEVEESCRRESERSKLFRDDLSLFRLTRAGTMTGRLTVRLLPVHRDTRPTRE